MLILRATRTHSRSTPAKSRASCPSLPRPASGQASRWGAGLAARLGPASRGGQGACVERTAWRWAAASLLLQGHHRTASTAPAPPLPCHAADVTMGLLPRGEGNGSDVHRRPNRGVAWRGEPPLSLFWRSSGAAAAALQARS